MKDVRASGLGVLEHENAVEPRMQAITACIFRIFRFCLALGQRIRLASVHNVPTRCQSRSTIFLVPAHEDFFRQTGNLFALVAGAGCS